MTDQEPKPKVVQKWDIMDRGTGVEVRTKYSDERVEEEVWNDDDAKELAEEILRIVESDDRPVKEGQHVR